MSAIPPYVRIGKFGDLEIVSDSDTTVSPVKLEAVDAAFLGRELISGALALQSPGVTLPGQVVHDIPLSVRAWSLGLLRVVGLPALALTLPLEPGGLTLTFALSDTLLKALAKNLTDLSSQELTPFDPSSGTIH